MKCFTRYTILFGAAIAALLISGCAADKELAKAQADAAIATGNARVAEAQRDAEEAKAVQRLADKIDAGGASAYLIAKAMRGITAQAAPVQVVQPQRSLLGEAFDALVRTADLGLRFYGIKAGRDVAIAQTDANRDVSIASYGAFTTMGQSIATAGTAGYPYIQAPGAITTTTLSGTGVIGTGTYTGPVTTTHNCNGGTGAAGAAGGVGGGTTAGAAGGQGGSGGSGQGGSC